MTTECCICYSKFRNGIKCNTAGKHAICTGCLERGDMVRVCRSGCRCWHYRCPVCRVKSYHFTGDVTDIKLARAIINALHHADDSDSDS